MIQKNAVPREILEEFDHMVLQLLLIDNDLHPRTAQYVGRTHEDRESELIGQFPCLIGIGDHTEFGIGYALFLEQIRETASIFGQIQRFETRSQDGDAVAIELLCQFERGLSAELNDDPLRLLVPNDIVDVLQNTGSNRAYPPCRNLWKPFPDCS